VKGLTPIGSREWFYCEGSQLLQEGEPDKSESTRDNIACHWVANHFLASYVNKDAEIKTDVDLINTLAPNDVLIDDEMIDAAKTYVTDILKYCNIHGTLSFVEVDTEVELDSFYPGMKGHIDACVFNTAKAELVIWLLKYEYGHVDVTENPELMLYAGGILDEMGIDGIADQNLTITFKMVQPRSFHHDGPVREWTVNGSDLRPFFNQLKAAADIAMQGTGQCITGTHCRYCKGRYKCTALSKSVYNAFDVITSTAPINITGNNLSVELKLFRRMSELIKYRLSALETQTERELLAGKVLSGFKLQQGYGRKRWCKDTNTKEVLMMADLLGVDLRKPDNLDTPTQSIVKFKKHAKAMGVKYDPKVVEQYFETPKTGLKIVEDDGKLAKQVFGNG